MKPLRMHVLSSPAGTDRDGQHREATALPGEPLQWRHLPAEQPPNSQKTGGRYFQGWVPKGSLMPRERERGVRARCASSAGALEPLLRAGRGQKVKHGGWRRRPAERPMGFQLNNPHVTSEESIILAI